MTRDDLFKEMVNVHKPMVSLMLQLRADGTFVHFVPASPISLQARLEVSAEREMVVAAVFVVEWRDEEHKWLVGELRYQRSDRGLVRVDPPAEWFERLPETRWFRGALQEWLSHERRVGCLAPA